MKTMPPIGATVKLIKSRSKKTAKVVGHLSDIHGGLVLDTALDGFRCWNKLDLERAANVKR